VEDGVVENNPFDVLDRAGVGGLMRIAKEKGRSVRPDLSIGICGEHGGNPSSVAFCHSLGINYVSCSPFRVPVARLAASHAAMGTLK
jgi:pyruvate,orthophosphate dikinase